eukprot:TRINITY_DN1989_c0_g1_i1.p1 TRINITY_DN1989_c0_g1~~TRINITY_DN1989_c0_g1_i1.p1  ORF type:complete len:431 (-),score=68.44 TRINITY_DN1989_c0_g1_i1:60-1352(-)
MCIRDRHYGGIIDYDVHNTFGFLESIATNTFLRQVVGTRFPLIISRSTLWGHGRYAAHWTGDNYANWTWLRVSIPQLFSFNVFGIPFVGADICGFDGNTTAELCARWMQLGAFYPFSRNHNIDRGIPQEPYVLGNLTLLASRNALKLRYSLLKYYYSVFCAQRGSGMVFKPLFFEFPEDENLYQEKTMNEQFLIGSDLMVTPILYEEQSMTSPYFPRGSWYDFYTGAVIQKSSDPPTTHVVMNPLPAPPPIFIREGALVFTQNTDTVRRSSQLGTNFDIIAAVQKGSDKLYRATGQIIGIGDYNDEVALEEKCVKGNCMVNISVVSDPKDPTLFRVYFTAQDPSYTDFEINVQSLKFYGLCMEHESNVAPRANSKDTKGEITKAAVRIHYANKRYGTLDVRFFTPIRISVGYEIEVKLQAKHIHLSLIHI